MGYEAASTDIGMYNKSSTFDTLGIAMLVCCTLMFCGQCWGKEALAGSFCGANVCYLIIGAIAGVRINKELDTNRENISLLNNFLVLNQCADQFTNVNTN